MNEDAADQRVAPIGDAAAIPRLDGEGPVWLQIRRSLAQMILGGQWPAGTRIPPEVSLTALFEASRMTVNKAIQSLAAEGLVERKPRTGTVVTARGRDRPVLEIWDAADAVRREGGHYAYRLVEMADLPESSPVRGEMMLPETARIVRLLCLHLSDERPFQLEERYISVDAALQIDSAPFGEVSPGPWLLANVPWTEARHAILAQRASEGFAALLEIAPGDPCLVVERRTWNCDVPVTLVRFWSAGGDGALKGSFRPSW